MVDDLMDMLSEDATDVFWERKKWKAKKFYSDYAFEKTIVISSENKNDWELAKRLRSESPSPSTFAGYGFKVKLEITCYKDVNIPEHML
jgi:hypothetical protein